MNALALIFSLAVAGLDCPPIAVIEGSGASAQELIAALASRGVRVEPPGLPPGDCGVLHVKVHQNGGGLHVSISDPWGRTAERTVKSALTAATLVETWARMDLLEGTQSATTAAAPVVVETPKTAPITNPNDQPPPLLDTPAIDIPKVEQTKPIETPAIASSTAAVIKPSDEPAIAAADTPSVRDPLMWRIAGEVSVRERERWIGVFGSVCGRIGFTCLGASARYDRSSSDRNAVDVLLDLSIPLSLGPLTLTPAVGFGGGWRTAAEYRFGRAFFRDPGPEFDGDDDNLAPRAEARLDAALRVSGNFALQIGASATFDVEVGDDFEGGNRVVRTYAGVAWGAP